MFFLYVFVNYTMSDNKFIIDLYIGYAAFFSKKRSQKRLRYVSPSSFLATYLAST